MGSPIHPSENKGLSYKGCVNEVMNIWKIQTFPCLTFSPQSLSAYLSACTFLKPILQRCGNALSDLSDLVQFHSGQVKNFYLLVLPQV